MRYVLSKDGKIQNSYQYGAFGEAILTEESVPNRLRYNAQIEDDLTGLYYLRARYYNPTTGRFTQEDVIYNDGLNLYAYCNSNPVMYCDPWGLAKAPCDEKNTAENYYSEQEKKRMNQTPLDGERGVWCGERGNSKYVPTDPEMKALLDKYGIDGIEYVDGVPHFSKFSRGTVEIFGMSGGTDGRPSNFKLAYQALSEQTGTSVKDLRKMAAVENLTWHELNDMKTLQLIPTKLNAYFGHMGGVGEIYLYFDLLEGKFD